MSASSENGNNGTEPKPKPGLPHKPWRAIQRLRHLSRRPENTEELLAVLHDAHARELVGRETIETVQRVMQINNIRVRDVMIPRANMVTVDSNSSPEKMLPTVINSGHSRFPVRDNDSGEINYILLAKDLLRLPRKESPGSVKVHDWFRKAVFVPESKRLPTLLREFRNSRNHMAIVVDEYGEAAGLITIEDVLEQIVGPIEDEYDSENEENMIVAQANSSYLVKGRTPIEDFNEHFHSDFEDEEFDTIGGLVLKAFGRFPHIAERTAMRGFEFEVLEADSRNIYQLKVVRLQETPQQPEAETESKSP